MPIAGGKLFSDRHDTFTFHFTPAFHLKLSSCELLINTFLSVSPISERFCRNDENDDEKMQKRRKEISRRKLRIRDIKFSQSFYFSDTWNAYITDKNVYGSFHAHTQYRHIVVELETHPCIKKLFTYHIFSAEFSMCFAGNFIVCKVMIYNVHNIFGIHSSDDDNTI